MFVDDIDELDIDEYESPPSNDLENHKALEAFVQDVHALAQGYIFRFFESREMYYGGKIPDKYLSSQDIISLVANTSWETGTQKAYQAIEEDGRYSCEVVESLVAEDVKLVISIMKTCAKLSIPQEFIPGLVLLYLKYCEGMCLEV